MAILAGQSMKFRVETPFGKENVPLCPRNCGASSIPQYWDFYVGFGCRHSSARDKREICNRISMRGLSLPHVRLFFLSHGQTGS
jgi:hypothetical protein